MRELYEASGGGCLEVGLIKRAEIESAIEASHTRWDSTYFLFGFGWLLLLPATATLKDLIILGLKN